MRKKTLSFMAVVSFLCAYATYASAGQLTLNDLYQMADTQFSASEAALRQAQAAVELARLNLSYCYILATHDGVMSERDIHEGQLVNPGQTLAKIVDANDIWVEANYRETQLPNIHIGDPVSIHVDAVPGITYQGRVERLSDATGSAFSMVPIDNATGNFVKVQQRLTIRISLSENTPEQIQLLKAGYSVECEVQY